MEDEYLISIPSFELMAKFDPKGQRQLTHKNCVPICVPGFQWMFRSGDLLRKLVGAWGFEPQAPTVSIRGPTATYST
jgi:hypothetical protein